MSRASSIHHPVFARIYTRLSKAVEANGVGAHRDELLAGVSGRVVEVGAGNGANFVHYPATVTEVVAVEPEPYLRERAKEAARSAPVKVTVVDGTADRLPLEMGSCDVGVASLVLCSVADQAAALAELHRVIRPGGELRFYEHIRSQQPRLARLQQRADIVWPFLGGGCHASRLTDEAIKTAGFVVEHTRYFNFRTCFIEVLVAPRVIGIARRP